MTPYSTGHIPDPPDCRESFHRLAGRLGSTTLPASVSLLPDGFIPLDQANTSACSGHASAVGLHLALGLPWMPSPAELYRNGRAIDRSPGEPLADEGAQPSQVFRAANTFGIRAMVPLAWRNSDADPSTINAEPKLGDLEEEALEVVVGDYGIDSRGAQRITDICTALAHGKPVCVAVAGGSAKFQAYLGGVLGPLAAQLDHYVLLVGYHTLADGTVILDGLNSWGLGWGDRGRFHLSPAAADELGDIVALDVRKA